MGREANMSSHKVGRAPDGPASSTCGLAGLATYPRVDRIGRPFGVDVAAATGAVPATRPHATEAPAPSPPGTFTAGESRLRPPPARSLLGVRSAGRGIQRALRHLLRHRADRAVAGGERAVRRDDRRSGEDTSELPSRPYLLCRLFLDKKK